MRDIEKRTETHRKEAKKVGLPSLDVRGFDLSFGLDKMAGKGAQGQIPNASVIYGIGAGVIYAAALYSFFTGAWGIGVLLCVPGSAFVAFALYFIRHSS